MVRRGGVLKEVRWRVSHCSGCLGWCRMWKIQFLLVWLEGVPALSQASSLVRIGPYVPWVSRPQSWGRMVVVHLPVVAKFQRRVWLGGA